MLTDKVIEDAREKWFDSVENTSTVRHELLEQNDRISGLDGILEVCVGFGKDDWQIWRDTSPG